ncbi:MAG: amino acid adenylation domain-containing protein [Coprococcus sp.]
MTFASIEEFDLYAEKYAKEPIKLTDKFLYRFLIFEVEGKSGVLVALSHLISDAWTFSLMANQVDAAYRNLAEGEKNELLESDYTEYIQAEKDYFLSDRYKKDKLYWKEKYVTKPEKSIIKISSSNTENIEAKRITKVLPSNLEYELQNYCKTNPVTPAVLFETALIIYLSRINPENTSITIGVPVLNRSNTKEKMIAGMFVSTMPLTVNVKQDMTVAELTEQITKEHMDVFRHQKYPYANILKSLREKQNFSGNLYDVMISYQNAKTDTGADTKWYSNGYSEIPFVIHIDNRDEHNSHTINVDYQPEVFKDEREVTYIIERLEYILEQITEEKIESVKEIDIIPYKEKIRVLEEFNDTHVEYPKDKCIHELFAEQAAKTPDRIALVAGKEKYTYRELDEKTNALAQWLISQGIEEGKVVGAYLDRTAYTVISQLAVLKAGGVFLPIDHRYPNDRIKYMIKDCDVKLVITDKELESKWNVKYINLKNYDFKDVLERSVKVSHEAPCYVIYTSGSTGKPKGCVLKHMGVANFCANNNIVSFAEELEHRTVVSVNTISFDFFIAETLLPLVHGWKVVLANDEESSNKKLFKKLVIENAVNIIETTPTRLEIYTKDEMEDSYFQQIQLIVSSGEALTDSLFQKIRTISGAKIYNPLGPSECSVWNVDGHFKTDITIGSPIANTQIYILDRDANIQPIGVAGELCIAGDGVGMGYLNRPELTAEKFVPNPFATEENHHGKVMYHTGDLARWRADGEIEYLGRIDTQVKIRGLRIELGEIESVMSGFTGIQLTAVSDKRDENNRQYLVGYYTAEGEIDEKELRSHLSSKLPKYMVPNYFVKLDEMPMTASGKTDRKNLPLPDFKVQINDYVAPETEQEMKLCNLLKDLLHMERVGVEDDFFEYGGDSLTAIEYVAKAHSMGIDFALQNVFDYPTVRKLCNFLNCGVERKVHFKLEDFDKYKELFDKNVVDDSITLKKKALGNILLTGATGFLGAHILDRLMQEENGKIYCLIRSNKADDRCGRLGEILKYYFGEKYESELNNRIIPIVGDIECEGLSDSMPSDVQTVIHAAASVKHFGSYSYFQKVNAEGTEHVVDYARAVGAKLIHISTLSVSGNSMADDFTVYRSEEEKFFYETSFYIGQPLDNVYIHSKFEAERRVYDAMLDGLDATVIRVGNLTNRASDYKFQYNYKENAFLTRVKAILEFGLFPDYLMKLYAEFSPIDKTAEGIVKIAQYADKQTVFHLNSNRVIYFDRFLDVVHELGISMKIVNGDTFNEELQKTIRNNRTEYIFEAFQNDMDERGHLVYDSNIRIENDFTLWFLKKVGFEWNETDMEYIKGYIDYFRKIGYLEV